MLPSEQFNIFTLQLIIKHDFKKGNTKTMIGDCLMPSRKNWRSVN